MVIAFKGTFFQPARVPDSDAKPLALVQAGRIFTPVSVVTRRPVIVIIT